MTILDKQIKDLQKLGLKENEAKVYLAGLKLGEAKVQGLVEVTGLKRTNVYALVNSLMNKGLFSVKLTGIKKKYVVEKPDKLRELAKEQNSKIITSLSSLVEGAAAKSSPGDITYYQGVAGLKNSYGEILEGLKPRDTYYVVGETKRWLGLDKKFFEKMITKRAKLRLDLKLILTDTPEARWEKKYEQNFGAQVKLLIKEVSLDMNLVIVPDKIMFQKLTRPITTIIVYNKEAADIQRQMFEIMWSALEG